MTPEAQRIAIAEACGWKPSHCDIIQKWENPQNPGFFRFGWGDLPDYLSDLNAMHEAEKVLDVTNGGPTSGDCLRYDYSRELYRLVPEWQQPFRATAAQRAEAFLKTLGKWTEETP